MSDETLIPTEDETATQAPLQADEVAEACEPLAEGEVAQETPEELAAREAAEKAAREAQEAAERRAADAAAREERAQAAVEVLSQGAGFNARYGMYYDATHGVIKAAGNAASALKEADQAADVDMADEQDEVDPCDVAYQVDDEAAEAQVQAAEAQAGYVDPVVFGRQVAKVTQAVTRNPVQREIFYKVLAFCQESQPLRTIEEKIQTFAEFKRSATNPYHYITILENAGGLERFDIDEEGDVVTAERKQGLTEDEIDDLVVEYQFMTTPAGQAVVDQHTPRARIIELLNLVPERKDTYIELMEFLSGEPRTYNEVSQLLVGRDVLWRLDSHGNPEKMQPSVFLDKLHAAAAIEWRSGWMLTEEGRAYLDELKGL